MILYIEIRGCDDSTLFQIEATELEVIFLIKLERMSKAISEYQCMPIINVYFSEAELKKHNLNKEDFKRI